MTVVIGSAGEGRRPMESTLTNGKKRLPKQIAYNLVNLRRLNSMIQVIATCTIFSLRIRCALALAII